MIGKKKRLLIVDDEKDICNFVKLLFRNRGFSVYSALSGEEAIRITKKIKPDIALLDIHLKKGIDGLEVLRQLKELIPSCRFVMVTWDGTQEKVKKAKKLGAMSYVTKPLTTKELCRVVDRIAKAINRKRGS